MKFQYIIRKEGLENVTLTQGTVGKKTREQTLSNILHEFVCVEGKTRTEMTKAQTLLRASKDGKFWRVVT